ncbi:heat stress transcription factor A-9-like [Lycium barbarum]|uniref:heat stress transcription factor A-9-like n=1 Tax=Lycium barbarum TaxID=112863 RepID=UPI00293EEC71|nr:heat stress transcription factor A-9-like [Lycium barbarum]
MAMNNVNQFSTGENGHGAGVKLLRGPTIPAFVTKTYHMVEDPNTNPIICWSPSGTSFVILDHIKFSSELLPKYFKHTNMSSFICQLNNYGFKKLIGLQKWEFENYWFQAGKKYLLTNVKGRGKNLKVQKDFSQKTYYYGVEEELRSQRDLNDTLKSEIEKMKERQEDMANEITTLKEYLENSQAESRKLLCYVAKTVKQVKRVVELVITRKRAEDTTGSSKSSWEKMVDDFSAIKQARDTLKKPKIEEGNG